MENVETRLHDLRTRRQEADRRRAQAEGKLSEVEARKAEILNALAAEGLTPETAIEEVSRLNAEVNTVLEEIAQKVDGL